MSDIWPSFVRTLTPRLAAWLMVVIARLGWDVPIDIATLMATELFAMAYYVVVRYLEVFRNSRWGRLLKPFGAQPGAPAYWLR